MHASVIDASPTVPAADSADDQPRSEPEWSTYPAQRRRTLLFLLFAGVYVGYVLVMRWVAMPLFDGDWFFFGGDPPPWYEAIYRWFLTLLPLAAWAGVLFVVLTRVRFLTHRRVAFVIIAAGLVFFEADMRWFQMSQKHVSSSEVMAFFDLDAASDLGLSASHYEEMAWQMAYHLLFLTLCAFLAGPEPRACIQAIWSGPVGRTYVGMVCRWCYRALVKLRLEAAVFRAVGWLDSKPAFACLLLLVVIDPIVIWSLDKAREDIQGEKTVVRRIADTNPLRWQSLDRAWDRVVFSWSAEAQDIAAANAAMRELDNLDAPAVGVHGTPLALAKRQVPAQPDNVIILQAETLNEAVFYETLPDMPYLNEFAKKCVRLKRHFSVANATHYGILGLMHGSPVTFFTGPRKYYRDNPYLEHFKTHGYKTRLITRSVIKHHSLGHYLHNWTDPELEPEGDFKCIPPMHEELAQPGPHLVYSFYHATHYPYDHDKDARFNKYLPEVDYDFNYNRPALFEWKEPILNRYKNTLINMDDWYRDILEKVDLKKTIVVITGDHGEEFFQQGRLGHCSSLNIHQTMTPCLLYIPGVEPTDVNFITSNADIMPTIADALGHTDKPTTLGQSLFAPVSFRYAVLSHFEYTKCKIWAVATEGRMAHFERDYWNNVEITSLTDWNAQRKSYQEDTQPWSEPFRIIRRVEEELAASGE